MPTHTIVDVLVGYDAYQERAAKHRRAQQQHYRRRRKEALESVGAAVDAGDQA